MSHYHSYDEAKRIDGATLERIEALAVDLNYEEACGATGLNGLLAVARSKGLSIRQLAACNSGDTAGGKARVVGYSAFALYEGEAPAAADAGRTLIEIARGSIANGLGLNSVPVKRSHMRWLLQPGATFVTLRKDGQLRGCIGSLSPERAARAGRGLECARRRVRGSALSQADARRMAALRARGVAALGARSRSTSPTRPTCTSRSAPARMA